MYKGYCFSLKPFCCCQIQGKNLRKTFFSFIISVRYGNGLQSRVQVKNGTGGGSTKYILYWNEAYGSKEYGFCCGAKPYQDFGCKFRNCHVTNNRSLLPSIDQFDAILFHQRSLDKNDLPAKRSPHQKYIMYILESASYPFGFVRYEIHSCVLEIVSLKSPQFHTTRGMYWIFTGL